MDNQSGRDLLSKLPVDVVESILVLVPISDAIRTSTLSSKWRFRWATIPQLVFDDESVASSVKKTRSEVCLKCFVTLTLCHHKGPLHKFKLNVSYMDSCPETDQWLLFLSRKDVKELIIVIEDCENEYFDMPSCLYCFQNLTCLNLYRCQFGPPPPTFKGFLCLRSLILEYVEVSSDTIESLVAKSPLLENLECTYVGSSEFRISAPYLKYYSLTCSVQEIHLCAPLLVKMSITMEGCIEIGDELPGQKHSVCNYTKFLGGCTNLERLTGDELFTKYLSIGMEYRRHPLKIHNLKIITLRVYFEDIDEILVVVRLIMDAANLHELQVKSYLPFFNRGDASKVPHINFWDSEYPQNCTFKKLKVVKMTDFRGALHEMKFIKFLLKSSPVLKKMIVQPSHFMKKKRMLNSIVKLLGYRRASTNATILFKKR